MTATWTPPKTWTSGEKLTKVDLDAQVRDNLEWLKAQIDDLLEGGGGSMNGFDAGLVTDSNNTNVSFDLGGV